LVPLFFSPLCSPLRPYLTVSPFRLPVFRRPREKVFLPRHPRSSSQFLGDPPPHVFFGRSSFLGNFLTPSLHIFFFFFPPPICWRFPVFFLFPPPPALAGTSFLQTFFLNCFFHFPPPPNLTFTPPSGDETHVVPPLASFSLLPCTLFVFYLFFDKNIYSILPPASLKFLIIERYHNSFCPLRLLP